MNDDLKPIRVAFPLGVGDCFWPCQKIRGLSKLFGHAPIHAFTNASENHKSVNFLRTIPCIEKAEFSVLAPMNIVKQMIPDYKDERWSTLDGAAGWNGFDYLFCANGHVEQGKPIKDFMPELETDYDFDYIIEPESEKYAALLMPDPEVLLYPSALGPNAGFHNMWWGIHDWVSVIRLLNESGITPTTVGANTPGDLQYATMLAAHRPYIKFKSIVGLTTIDMMIVLLKTCRLWMGLSSGFGIVSAAMKTPTVMFWSDDRWPMGKVSFKTEMQWAWLEDKPFWSNYYRTFHFGSPDMDAEVVVGEAMEIMR